jgi:hypothetical protein
MREKERPRQYLVQLFTSSWPRLELASPTTCSVTVKSIFRALLLLRDQVPLPYDDLLAQHNSMNSKRPSKGARRRAKVCFMHSKLLFYTTLVSPSLSPHTAPSPACLAVSEQRAGVTGVHITTAL